MPVFCLLLDLWAAYLIRIITELYNKTKEAEEDRLAPPPAYMGHAVALLYVTYFSHLLKIQEISHRIRGSFRYLYLPFSWATSAAQSTAGIDNLVVLHALYYALQGSLYFLAIDRFLTAM